MTRINLDDELVRQAIAATGKPANKAAVEEAMHEFINARRRQDLIKGIEQGDLGMI